MTAKLVEQNGAVEIYELLGSRDDARIEAMLNLYAELFPQYAHYVPRMLNRAQSHPLNERGHIVHYWLIEVDGNPAAIRTFRYIPHKRCGVAIALAVHPDYRKTMVGEERLAVYIINKCLEQVIQDAKEAGDPPVWGMVNEVESARLMEHYGNYGIIELPIKYFEPIFPSTNGSNDVETKDAVDFSPMHLGFLYNPEMKEKKFTSKDVAGFAEAFLVEHYEIPLENEVVQKVLQSVSI